MIGAIPINHRNSPFGHSSAIRNRRFSVIWTKTISLDERDGRMIDLLFDIMLPLDIFLIKISLPDWCIIDILFIDVNFSSFSKKLIYSLIHILII